MDAVYKNATYITYQGPGTPSMNEVQWYSVFWALTTFGLNSMTQPAGSVCGAPAYVSFMLRASPIICIIDTFVLFHRLATYYLHSDTTKARRQRLRDAQERLLLLRFQPNTDAAEDPRTELVNLQKNQAARIFAFLWTLAQMIKLYSYAGVTWTKVIASVYLASFLAIEVLVVWPRTRVLKSANSMTKREKEIRGSGATSLPYISIGLAVAFMLWALAVACKDIFGQSDHTLPRWLAIVLATLGGLFCVLSFAFGVLKSAAYSENVRAALLLIPTLGVPWIYFGLELLLARYSLRTVLVQIIAGALAVVWVVFALMFMSASTRTVRVVGQDRARYLMEQTTAWVFLCLHVLTGLLYYMYSYDPAGTVKPAWAEFLG